MQANRFHLGKVIEELEQNIIDSALMEEAKIKSKGLDQIVFAYYLVLRSEAISSKENFPSRKL
jgi:hypothetical protein